MAAGRTTVLVDAGRGRFVLVPACDASGRIPLAALPASFANGPGRGPAGPRGEAGSCLLSGQGVPDPQLGNTDDCYVDYANGAVYKKSVQWDLVGTLAPNYVHNQSAPATVWTIEHGLGRFPSLTVVDSGGTAVVGEVTYISDNAIRVTFSAAFSGKAYLN